jgi:hypothetical protein
MASRSSGNFNSEFYIGTRRGRFDGADMGFEMFPEKYEETKIYEDPDQLNEDRRETLKDFTPDNSRLFAYEEPRRVTYAHDALNLRDGGARTTTDPWANDEWDNSFHDKDPRGWNTEQPWQEYRRHLEAQLRMTDFKDDGDYSVTSGHVHPNTLYRTIRGAQDWVKSRLKIFETSLTNNHNGGVGVYANISNVFKSEYEDQSRMMDGSMNTTFEDPENRGRATMRLSNMVHGGSKALRVNSTTDHKVLVAAYGKLMRQRGLINHENQLRLLEDDTNWSKIEGNSGGAPRNFVQLMSNLANGTTSAETARLLNQDNDAAPALNERFRGIRYDESEVSNRNYTLTRDIMSLLGITENELKLLESRANKNEKAAQHALANLYEMAETVHRQPAHIKLQIRDDLLLKSAGAGIIPSTGYNSRASVVVNPKLLSFMSSQTRTTKSQDQDLSEANWNADADSENVLDKAFSKLPLLVYKSSTRDSDEIAAMWTQTNHLQPGSKRAHSYHNLVMTATSVGRNRDNSDIDTWFDESGKFKYGKLKTHENDDVLTAAQHAEVDNEFGENRALTRHIGRIGTKHTSRYHQRDNVVREDMEIENVGRKTSKHR